MNDLVPCSRCKQDVAVSEFGRCSICGDILREATLSHRRSIFGFTNKLALVGMLVGLSGTVLCLVTLSLFGLSFTIPLMLAALRYRHQSL